MTTKVCDGEFHCQNHTVTLYTNYIMKTKLWHRNFFLVLSFRFITFLAGRGYIFARLNLVYYHVLCLPGKWTTSFRWLSLHCGMETFLFCVDRRVGVRATYFLLRNVFAKRLNEFNKFRVKLTMYIRRVWISYLPVCWSLSFCLGYFRHN